MGQSPEIMEVMDRVQKLEGKLFQVAPFFLTYCYLWILQLQKCTEFNINSSVQTMDNIYPDIY